MVIVFNCSTQILPTWLPALCGWSAIYFCSWILTQTAKYLVRSIYWRNYWLYLSLFHHHNCFFPSATTNQTTPNASSTITTESNENIFIFWPQKSPSKSPPLELQNTTNQLTNRNLPHDHQIKWPGSLLSGKNWNTGMRDPNSPHLLLLLLCNGPENAQNIKIFVKRTLFVTAVLHFLIYRHPPQILQLCCWNEDTPCMEEGPYANKTTERHESFHA